MALFINGVGQDSFSMNGISIDNLYVDGVLVWSSYVNTAPVITIIGDNPMYLVLNGSAYVEQGATATDAEDGDITNDIVIGGDTPDVSVEGFYYVTYNVTDSDGLAADEAVRTVSVYVVTMPKYELTEALINDGTFDYIDDSNNPEHTYDGKLTESDGTTPYLPTELQYPGNGLLELDSGRIMDTQYVAPQADGGLYGIYDADGSTEYKVWGLEPTISNLGNIYEGDQDTPITLTHTGVEISALDNVSNWTVTDGRPSWMPPVDVTKPVITMLGTSPIDVDQDSVYTDEGATALDDTDGDITANIVTVNNVDTAVIDTYNVTYNVDDSSGNSADEVTRVVNVVSTVVLPVPVAEFRFEDNLLDSKGNYTTSNPVSISYGVGKFGQALLGNGTTTGCNHNIDFATTEPISVAVWANLTSGTAGQPDFIFGKADAQTVYIQNGRVVTHGEGREVSTSQQSNADITNGEWVHIVFTSTSIATPPLLYIDSILQTTSLFNDFWACSAGAIACRDHSSTKEYGFNGLIDQLEVYDYILSQEEITNIYNDSKESPIITMLGSSPVNVVVDDVYTDAGATAHDYIDGDITSDIVTGGLPIDTSAEGTHNVTYNVQDSSGNHAEEVTRIVNVSEAGVVDPTNIVTEYDAVIYNEGTGSFTYTPNGRDLTLTTITTAGTTNDPDIKILTSEVLDGAKNYAFVCTATIRTGSPINLTRFNTDTGGNQTVDFDIVEGENLFPITVAAESIENFFIISFNGTSSFDFDLTNTQLVEV